MKIGIITFHWATNYGAVLQTYALQSFLRKNGHDVEIIDYKPSVFDNNIRNFIVNRKFIHLGNYLNDWTKESHLQEFRKKYLHLSKRFKTVYSLEELSNSYNVLITGSDQVLNPYFLQFGEKNGSEAYFLNFVGSKTKRIAYAVSFGVTKYPDHLIPQIRTLLSKFLFISTREKTGSDIVSDLGLPRPLVVPDPTLLLKAKDYSIFLRNKNISNSYLFVYLLHNRKSFLNKLKARKDKFLFSTGESVETWLGNIKFSRGMITNSYHGIVFSLHFHIPFVVVLESKENKGMNDRFYTLLEKCNLLDVITTEKDYNENILQKEFDWIYIDKKLEEYRKLGSDFLQKVIEL